MVYLATPVQTVDKQFTFVGIPIHIISENFKTDSRPDTSTTENNLFDLFREHDGCDLRQWYYI